MGNTRFLSLITMLLITKDADGEFWPWDMAQLNSARETLILLGIVVLQTNLQVDCLDKFAFLGFLRIFEDLADTLKESLFRDFACPRHDVFHSRGVVVPVFETEGVILFLYANAAAFSLISVVKFFFVELVPFDAAFREDNVVEYSFGFNAILDDATGLLFARISAILACLASFFACSPFDNADPPEPVDERLENPENLDTISFTL